MFQHLHHMITWCFEVDGVFSTQELAKFYCEIQHMDISLLGDCGWIRILINSSRLQKAVCGSNFVNSQRRGLTAFPKHTVCHIQKKQLHRDTCKKTQTPAAAAGDNNCRKWRLLSMNYSKGSYNIKSKLQFNTLCLCIIIDLFCFVLLFPTNTSVCLSVCLLFVSLLFHSYFPSSASLPRII